MMSDPVPDQPKTQPADAVGGEGTGPVRRLGREALRRPSPRQFVVAALLAVLGFATVVQVRATGDDSTYAGYREQDLIDVLNGLAATTQRTQTEIDRLTEARDELRSVDAEAIQINGQVRLVAQSSIEDAPGGLRIDGVVVESPFVIDAIGVASTLAGAMNFALGPRNELENDGASVEVVELGSLDIDTVASEFRLSSGEPG